MLAVLAAIVALAGCSSARASETVTGEELLGASSAEAFSECARTIEQRSPRSGVWTYTNVSFDETPTQGWTVRGVVAHGAAADIVEPFECTISGV
ncbi:hypothetical protein [Rhodococcoides fascians]|uniref:hypothetical protein n=1 Tax=Rhodococcoides fascians TaxID=1828 RepID=UPI0012D2F8C8|nr:hypothetical protein [Rhodococcus fascians]